MDAKEAKDLLEMVEGQTTYYTSDDQIRFAVMPEAVVVSIKAWLKAESLKNEAGQQ